MSDHNQNCKTQGFLFLSVAVNIFLVAFVLGRFSAPMPPPHGPMGFGIPGGMMPPPMEMRHGDRGPPPFMGPGQLFSPDEMKKEDELMHQSFEKANALRRDFAARLDKGAVTKDEVLQHFAGVDQVMDGVRKEAQEKAAEKISAMSQDDRLKFARSLLNDGPPQGGPPQDDRGPR